LKQDCELKRVNFFRTSHRAVDQDLSLTGLRPESLHGEPQRLFSPLSPDSFTKVNKLARVHGLTLLEGMLTAEVLPVWVFDPAIDQGLIAQVVDLLEQRKANIGIEGLPKSA